MRIPALLLCLAVLLPAAGAARPLPQDTESIELWFLADITITPEGRVSRHAWRNVTGMPAAVLQALGQQVTTWEFQPASVDGMAVETDTSLVIHALAFERPDGAFRMEIANATTGPSLLDGSLPEPAFPDPWRSGYGSGAQRFDVTVPPAGDAVIQFGEYIADTKRSPFEAGFRMQARDMVSHWRVRHERVAGKPVTAQFRHVVYHCRSPRWCAAKTAHWDLPAMPPGHPVPLNSATRLLTDVATVDAPDDPDIPTAKAVMFPAGSAR